MHENCRRFVSPFHYLALLFGMLGFLFLEPLDLGWGNHWDEQSRHFRWWAGQVRVPGGFRYIIGFGSDTFQGEFVSMDGSVSIKHDIGGYAGAYSRRLDANYFRESRVGRSRVWITKRTERSFEGELRYFAAVTFPDSGCANFFVRSAKAEDGAVIDFIASSFRPAVHAEAHSMCLQR